MGKEERVPDAAGLVTVSADSDEDQAMENELVASKLDCNHDDQLEVESPGRAEVDVDINTIDQNKETEEDLSTPSVDKEIKTVDEENNVDITTQAGKEIEDEEIDKTNE